MIVKKIPILQGFPTLETVKYLSNTKNELSEYNPIFYDIETTGLSRYTAFVYLIGAVRFEENQWMLYQWMGEDENEEALVLQEFASFLTNADCTIQYNGNRFDQPFLPFWKNVIENTKWILHLKKFYPLIYISC